MAWQRGGRGGGGRGWGGRGGGGRGGGRFDRNRGNIRNSRNNYDFGPPSSIVPLGTFVHAVQGEMLYKSLNVEVPKFNSSVYLENRASIGKIEEVLGPINQPYFSVKPGEGIVASSFKVGDKVFIAPDRVIPLDRFLKPLGGGRGVKKPGVRGLQGKGVGKGNRGGRGRGRGMRGGRGGRGGGRGGWTGKFGGKSGGAGWGTKSSGWGGRNARGR